MKSGIKSTGDNAYATVTPDNILAGLGVSISFKAKNKAGISVFNFFAFTLKSIYKTTAIQNLFTPIIATQPGKCKNCSSLLVKSWYNVGTAL